MELVKTQTTPMPKIVVIGAGVAGFSAALALANRGYTVQLIEKNTLGSGSSGRNPGRMGHGFHYVDSETAIMYLHASIQVQRKYPQYLVGQHLPFDHPIRHGRYFITKNSDISIDRILDTYNKIQREYRRLVTEDPDNEVFGPPENFFRILKPHEYANQVNTDLIELGVETAEHLFDWQKFVVDIKTEILAHPNITLYEHTEVEFIERGEINESRFKLHIKKNSSVTGNTSHIFHTDYIVNSTWQDIERLNAQIGIPMVYGSRTNRLKALLLVKLPESLVNVNSMFFCMGQHCMFSNLGNGYGMMTYAHVTNMDTSQGLKLSDFANRLVNGGATEAEKEKISIEMLHGVANYIPEIINSTIIDIKFGIVQTAGKLALNDLTNPDNTYHKRNYYGIREEQIGLISNPAIKLFYFVENGVRVTELIDAQCMATNFIHQCINNIEKIAKINGYPYSTALRHTILTKLEKYTSSSFVLTKSQKTFRTSNCVSLTIYEKIIHYQTRLIDKECLSFISQQQIKQGLHKKKRMGVTP